MSVSIITLDRTQLLGKLPDVPSWNSATTWMAGGAVRRRFTGQEELSDVDFFFADKWALDIYLEVLALNEYVKLSENKNSVTLSNGKLTVQCIRVAFFPTIEALLDSFDFTVCQFAFDGTNVYSTPEAVISVLRNHLGVHRINPEFAVDSLRRSFKYAKKGFYPCSGTLQKIAHSLRTLTEQQVNDAIEISPGGGRRTVRID